MTFLDPLDGIEGWCSHIRVWVYTNVVDPIKVLQRECSSACGGMMMLEVCWGLQDGSDCIWIWIYVKVVGPIKMLRREHGLA